MSWQFETSRNIVPLNSALVFKLAQVPIKSEDTDLSTTQPLIIAQNGRDGNGDNGNDWNVTIPWWVLGIIVFLLLLVFFRKNLGFLVGWAKRFSDSGQKGEVFAVSHKLSNVRTQDFFRAEIKGTVYVTIENEEKASSMESEDGIITEETVSNFVRDMFDAAIRQAASKRKLESMHTEREEFCTGIKNLLNNNVQSLGLSLGNNAVVIAAIDETNTYNPDNYFDARGIKDRTETIQKAILETREVELEKKAEIKQNELDLQKSIREKELKFEQEMREKELKFEQNIRQKELENELDKQLEEAELDSNKEIEMKRNDIETAIQLDKIEKDTQVAGKNKEYQILQGKNRVEVEEEIEKSQNESTATIKLAKLDKDIKVAEENKKFESKQGELQQELEKEELEGVIKIIDTEKTKLNKEEERAKAIEAITTAVELAQVKRENTKTQLIKEGRIPAEAAIIETLAKAEELRYKAVPKTDLDRLVKLIREELMDKKKKKVNIVEISKALTKLANNNYENFEEEEEQSNGKSSKKSWWTWS